MSELVIYRAEDGKLAGFGEKGVVSRAEAIDRGLRHYFTGIECRHGHIDLRFTKTQICLECNRIKAREWGARNKEIVANKNSAYYLKNRQEILHSVSSYRKTNREKIAAWHKANYQRNKHKWSEKKRPTTAASKAVMAKRTRAFRLANPERFRAYKAKRRAMAMASPGQYTAQDVQTIIRLQKYRCTGCRASIKSRYHVDHVFPLSKGGSNGPENIQILCPSCNVKKSAKDPIRWANEQGRLL